MKTNCTDNNDIEKQKPRQGWEEAFRNMVENDDDQLLYDDTVTISNFDEEEWEWE